MASTLGNHSGMSNMQENNQRPLGSFQIATEKEDWAYQLRSWDIQLLGIHEFGLPEQNFFVGTEADLRFSLARYLEAATSAHENKVADPYIFIVNVDAVHWSALVIFESRGFYADSLKRTPPPFVLAVLTANGIKDFVVLSVGQQLCGWNCGYWALINAKVIAAIIKKIPNASTDLLKNYLLQTRIPTAEYREYFRMQRRKSADVISLIPSDGSLSAGLAQLRDDDNGKNRFFGNCSYNDEINIERADFDVDKCEVYSKTRSTDLNETNQEEEATLSSTRDRTAVSSSSAISRELQELERNVTELRRPNSNVLGRNADEMDVTEIYQMVVENTPGLIESKNRRNIFPKSSPRKQSVEHINSEKTSRADYSSTTLPRSAIGFKPTMTKCPQDNLHGAFDLDSFVIVAETFNAFKANLRTKFHMNKKFYRNVSNTKLIDDLTRKLVLTKYKLTWIDFTVADYDDAQLFVILAMHPDYFRGKNWAWQFQQSVIFPSFATLPIKSASRKEFRGPGSNVQLNRHSNLYSEDCNDFSARLECNMTAFVNSQYKNVHSVYLYKCIHGIKYPVQQGVDHVRNLIDQSQHVILIQFHIGITINAPIGSHIILDYEKLERVLGGSNSYVKQRNYFLRRAGFFHGSRHPPNYPRIQYLHAYETISHRISDHTYPMTVFAYALANGFRADFYNFRLLRERTETQVKEIRDWYEGSRMSLDCRIEVVVSCDNNISDLDASNYPIEWIVNTTNFSTAATGSLLREPLKEFVSGAEVLESFIDLPIILDELAAQGAFLLVTNFTYYAKQVFEPDLVLLQNALIRGGINISRESMIEIYAAEQRVMCFIEGSTYRYDYEFLNRPSLRLDTDEYSTFFRSTLSNIPNNFWERRHICDKLNIITRYTNIIEAIYKTTPIARPLLNADRLRCTNVFPTTPEEYIIQLLLRLAIVRNMHAFKTWENVSSHIDITKFFRQEKGYPKEKVTHVITMVDVKRSVEHPQHLATALFTSHVVGNQILNEGELAKALDTFLTEHVEYWPYYFIEKDADRHAWAKIYRRPDNSVALTIPDQESRSVTNSKTNVASSSHDMLDIKKQSKNMEKIKNLKWYKERELRMAVEKSSRMVDVEVQVDLIKDNDVPSYADEICALYKTPAEIPSGKAFSHPIALPDIRRHGSFSTLACQLKHADEAIDFTREYVDEAKNRLKLLFNHLVKLNSKRDEILLKMQHQEQSEKR